MPYKDPKNPKNIAYKKAYYERTKIGRYQRIKHNIYKWRKSHPDLYDQLKKEYYKDNKRKILERQKESYRKHIKKRHEAEKKRVAELTDVYMRKYLIKVGFTRKQLRKNPELIEMYRAKLLLIRTIKNKQNGKK